jgi:hypothetical protein
VGRRRSETFIKYCWTVFIRIVQLKEARELVQIKTDVPCVLNCCYKIPQSSFFLFLGGNMEASVVPTAWIPKGEVCAAPGSLTGGLEHLGETV